MRNAARRKSLTLTITTTHPIPTLVDLDLKLKTFDAGLRANFVLILPTIAGNVLKAEFTYNAGAASDAVRVSVVKSYDGRTDKTSCTVTLYTLVRQTTTETGEVENFEESAGLFWNYSGRTAKSTQFITDRLGAAFGFVAKTLTAANGYPTTSIVDALDRGVLTTVAL